jgi:hypothetical protein
MARVIPAGKITWGASPSADVVAYRVYWETDDRILDYDSPYAEFAADATEAQLPLVGMDPMIDEDVEFGVVAVDDKGNLSDISTVIVPLDMTPPEAPVNVQYVP